MVVYDKQKTLIRREPIITDVTDKVQRFGLDNLYPQRAEEAAKHSHTLKSVLDTYADFLNGEGFQDPAIAALILNDDGLTGQTANDVLRDISIEYSKWKTIPLHIQYNMNYRICSIRVIPFEYIRYGRIMDGAEDYETDTIQYSTNWERDGRRELKFPKICGYDIFNPDPWVVAQQIANSGGIFNYKGQIAFITPKPYEYPLATYDTVLNHAQVQDELSLFDLSTIQNRFNAELAIVYPGEYENNDEKQAFQDLIKSKSGSRNGGTRIGLQDKTGTKKASDIFQPLNQPNTDKMYEATKEGARDAIVEAFYMPKILIGVKDDGGMFNQDDIENAYTYYNSRTRNDRADISRKLSKIFMYWETPITNPCVIKPQQYLYDEQAGTDNVNVRDNLANMSGRQAQNMGRIIRKYAKGEYSLEQARVLLQGGFGLSNEEIDKLLGVNEETPTTGPTMQNLYRALKNSSEFELEIYGFKSKDWLK